MAYDINEIKTSGQDAILGHLVAFFNWTFVKVSDITTMFEHHYMSFDLGNFYKHAEIGIGFIGFGFFFTFLGVVLFFDRGLLALGNIFWLAGVAILLGWHSMWTLFTNRANYKGSASFLLGLFFIFVRWPIVGIILEIYGCVVLFSGFWSSIKVFLYHIPIVGWIIQFISPP